MRTPPWLMPVLASLALPMTIAASAHGPALDRLAPAAAATGTSTSAADPVPNHPTAAVRVPARPQRAAVRRPAPVHRAAPPPPVTRVVEASVARPAAPTYPTGPTSWGPLNAAIARIPTYRPGEARWVISSAYGHWGTADWYADTLYIAPNVPTVRLYDVAVHEWSHELSVLDYAGDVNAAVAAMNGYFGGSGLVGAERAADCMAILQGAQWTHYTSCQVASWRAGAARLINRERL